MPKISASVLRRSSRGAALVIMAFISIVAIMITVTMLSLSQSNTKNVSNDSLGKTAFYAAEAGLANVISTYNGDFIGYWMKPLSVLPFPTEDSPEVLNNGSSYWVDSLEYDTSKEFALVEIIGKSKNATRKFRARLETRVPKPINDFGLLTDGTLAISGDKYIKMSAHANRGLSISGTNNMFNSSTISQSSDKSAGAADPATKSVGGYIPPVKVPEIPINYYRTYAKTGITLYANDPNLQTKINNTPATTPIYINGNVISAKPNQSYWLARNTYSSGRTVLLPAYTYNTGNIKLVAKTSTKGITFEGNQNGRFIFIEGNAILNAAGINNLSNMTVVTAGDITVNGSIDIDSSHGGKIDTIFASMGQITLNGERNFAAMFWTEDTFRQNGSSVAGKVMARNNINFNGSFTLEPSSQVDDSSFAVKEVTVSYWQQIPMDEEI